MRRVIYSSSAILMMFAAGCGGDDKGDGEGTKVAGLRGRVADTEKARFEGAKVTAFKMDARGMLTAVSDGAATVGADGKYDLDVDVTAGAVEDVVVRIEKGEERASVLAAKGLESGADLVLAPVDAETDAEAELEVEARASASAAGEAKVDRAQLRELVTPELGIVLGASSARSADVKASAKSIAAAVIAMRAAIEADTSKEQVDAAAVAIAKARADFDAALDAATSSTAAVVAYDGARAAAYADADVGEETLAAAQLASASAMRVYAGDAATAVHAELLAATERVRAGSVGGRVTASFAAMDASEATAAAVNEATTQLYVSVEEALAAEGSEIDSKLAAAYDTYATEVLAQLEADLPLAQRIKLLEVQLAIEAAQSTLMSALDALSGAALPATTAAASADAIASYRSTVEAEANLSTLTGAAIGAAEAKAMLVVIFEVTAANRSLGTPQM